MPTPIRRIRRPGSGSAPGGPDTGFCAKGRTGRGNAVPLNPDDDAVALGADEGD